MVAANFGFGAAKVLVTTTTARERTMPAIAIAIAIVVTIKGYVRELQMTTTHTSVHKSAADATAATTITRATTTTTIMTNKTVRPYLSLSSGTWEIIFLFLETEETRCESRALLGLRPAVNENDQAMTLTVRQCRLTISSKQGTEARDVLSGIRTKGQGKKSKTKCVLS